jgi:N-methylhydantoinase A
LSYSSIRLAVDIGGTFTDVAFAIGDRNVTTKVLTTAAAPEEGVMTGIARVVEAAKVSAANVGVVIHGTTLATNAIIERKGAHTALVVTEGFRDSVEMAYENRFEQYDIEVQKPKPLVPRYLRLPVTERVDAGGKILVPLDLESVDAVIAKLEEHAVESVAIGLLHCYANSRHEEQVAERIAKALPALSITLSSEACPEIREYERLSTACANAYVQPIMARYVRSLDARLKDAGFACPLLLMTSGGGLTTVETAARHPIRLVESGPAGGAILASRIATSQGLDRVLSFDMGGTTAKICLIDDGKPQSSRTFEVDRIYRFTKGSGLPLRIPVIEMVEIGAGGGSVARVDGMKRVNIGPESAGSEPGPACYGNGGTRATVTDADVLLGRIEPEDFAGGSMRLDSAAARNAIGADVGEVLNLDTPLAAFAVSEVVDENMANAARVHAIERGKDLVGRALIAFGGAAPVHAARLAEKLGIATVIVPTDAGVGSAVGFLNAPVSYEVVRSRYMRLSALDAAAISAMFDTMGEEAQAVVRLGAPVGRLHEQRVAYMRYVGQGHEVSVSLPLRKLEPGDADTLQQAFDETYTRYYGRTIPDMDVEVLTWALTLTAPVEAPSPVAEPAAVDAAPTANGERKLFNTRTADFETVPVYSRDTLAPGMRIAGPAIVTESQTTTVVARDFDARIDGRGYIILERRNQPRSP